MLGRNIKLNNATLTAAALALINLIAGCGGGGAGDAGSGPGGNGGGTDTTLPTIINTGAVPTQLPSFDGGTTIIRVDAADAGGIKKVAATISKPDGTTATVTLTGSGTYSASFDVAPNVTDKPVTYTAVVTATDNANNSTTSTPITITVPTAEAPPVPPTPPL